MLVLQGVLAFFDPLILIYLLRMCTRNEALINYSRTFVINTCVAILGVVLATWCQNADSDDMRLMSLGIVAVVTFILLTKIALSPKLNAIPVTILFLGYKAAVVYFAAQQLLGAGEEIDAAMFPFPAVEADVHWLDPEFWYESRK